MENLAKLGIVATCNAGGAGKWKGEHAAHLKGADVVIIPDNDPAGQEHAKTVATSLTGVAKRVRILELPNLHPRPMCRTGSRPAARLMNCGGSSVRPRSGRQQLVRQTAGRRLSQQTSPGTRKWAEPVNDAAFADAIAETYRLHVVLPEHGDTTATLWTIYAHAFDAFPVSPILAVESPEKRCGKTTLLELLELLTPRGYMT